MMNTGISPAENMGPLLKDATWLMDSRATDTRPSLLHPFDDAYVDGLCSTTSKTECTANGNSPSILLR